MGQATEVRISQVIGYQTASDFTSRQRFPNIQTTTKKIIEKRAVLNFGNNFSKPYSIFIILSLLEKERNFQHNMCKEKFSQHLKCACCYTTLLDVNVRIVHEVQLKLTALKFYTL